MVILNSLEVTKAMLDKKGTVYSDRPLFPVSGTILGFTRFAGFKEYGPRLKDMRRLIFQTVGTHTSLMQLMHAQEDHVYDFLRSVASDPSSLSRHVHR